jgi:hypothetical protein
MPIARLRIPIDQAGDFARTYVWQSGAPGSVAPVDLSAASGARLLIFASSPSSTIVSISTTPNAEGSIVLGGPLGSVAIVINKATTTTILPGAYAFQLWIDWANGTSTLFLSGPCVVNVT